MDDKTKLLKEYTRLVNGIRDEIIEKLELNVSDEWHVAVENGPTSYCVYENEEGTKWCFSIKKYLDNGRCHYALSTDMNKPGGYFIYSGLQIKRLKDGIKKTLRNDEANKE